MEFALSHVFFPLNSFSVSSSVEKIGRYVLKLPSITHKFKYMDSPSSLLMCPNITEDDRALEEIY